MSINLNRNSKSDFLSDIDFVIEANSFEWACVRESFEKNRENIQIKESPSGTGATVAHDELGRPVFISLRTVDINGKKVLILEATSKLVDWDAIYNWFTEVQGWSADRVNSSRTWTDANNSHNLLHFCDK